MSTTLNVDERPPVANEHGVAVRPALETLSRLRSGRIMDELSLEINRVVNGVKDSETGKGGSVTLTLKIDRVPKFPNAVAITATVVGKAPQDPPSSDLMFFDEDGNLHTRNPNQRDIFEGGPHGI